ncbi:MAG: PKD domain-containing protein [Ignavibacteriales bacterium]|nr:PKD domain-containing protein [Ignavibacteriales bacterium]
MKNYFFLILAAFFLFFSSCKKSDNPTEPGDGNSNKIELGTSVDLINQVVNTGGGTIKISRTGDPLDEMEITVPPNSFNESKTFSVSYAEIKTHQLGQYFNPISPMIKIKYEGGYANYGIMVKIPIKLPKGHFAMGFFYDEKTGKLEGLPIEELDSNSIKISTRHFNSNSTSAAGLKKAASEMSLANIIISSIDEAQLKSLGAITCGFQPGYDDWEFINYGSYIATGGQCAGQSMTAMWYYIEQKLKGEPSLFHKFDLVNDNTKPNLLWQDNPKGYKFASVIQRDFNWDDWIKMLIYQFNHPDLTLKAFALSMLLTNEPQFVLIRQSQPNNAAHAVICYEVNMNDGALYIADPNFPNNRIPKTGDKSIRKIEYSNGKFIPYPSSLNASTSSINFDEIGYFAKTAYINWSQIGSRFKEFKDGTIGTIPPYTFPDYILRRSADGMPLYEGMIIDKDTLTIDCYSEGCTGYINFTNHLQYFEVYNELGDTIAKCGNDGHAILKLKPGTNKLGFYIVGYNGNKPGYLDFKWLTITSKVFYIDPPKINAEPDEPLTFYARTNGSAPNNAKYVWTFGDDTPDVIKINDSTVTHTYTREGYFSIQCNLYDNTTGQLVSLAFSYADIIIGDLSELLSCTKMYIHLRCHFNWLPEKCVSCGGDMVFLNQADTIPSMQLKWSGTSFTYNYNFVLVYGQDSSFYTGSISGKVSSDVTEVENLIATQTYWSPPDYEVKDELELQNLPIEKMSLDMEKFLHQSYYAASSPYVKRVKSTIRQFDKATQQWKTSEATTIDWQQAESNLLYFRFGK